jgi:flagellar motor switch protein FliN/FliY
MMELESYFNKTNKKSVSFRLSETIIDRLKDMSETLGVSQTEIIELLVSALYYSGTEKNSYKDPKWFEKVLEMCGKQISEIPPDMDIDILGEMYNVGMGAAASSMSTLLKRKVDIHTPKIKIVKLTDFAEVAPAVPAVGVRINYITGLHGEITFIFSQRDVVKIVDIWTGGNGSDDGAECGPMHQSALVELMKQAMGQASEALQGFLDMRINTSAPSLFRIEQKSDGADLCETAAVIKLGLTVADSVDSELTVVLPMPLVKHMISKTKKSFGMTKSEE